MHLIGILFELYLASFAQIAGFTPEQFLKSTHNTYHAPLNGALEIIGNCGELRANHFHTGWDLGTSGKEGLPVFSIEDGFISRIRITSSGYGKAVYITHSNGMTSVYAHLSRFNDKLDSFVVQEMQRLKQNEFDWYWSPTCFKIKKGELIAFSGNSGSSTGPHLHFELRDAFTEVVLNPSFLFKNIVRDDIKPMIHQIVLSVQDVNGVRYVAQRKDVNQSSIALSSPHRQFFLSVCGEDKAGTGKHHLGIYRMELKDENGKVVYQFVQDKLVFKNGRYANAVNDYLCQDFKSSGAWYTLFKTSNNRWPFNNFANNGLALRKDSQTYNLLLEDENGLISTYTIHISFRAATEKKPLIKASKICLHAGQALRFSPDENIEVNIPASALYENIYWYANSFKALIPTAFHQVATVKMYMPSVKLAEKQGSYMQVLGNNKTLETVKVLWKGDTAIFQVKYWGKYVYKREEKLPYAVNSKGKIYLKNVAFLSQYAVFDAKTMRWIPVEFNPKTGQLKLLDKIERGAILKIICTDTFGRENVSLIDLFKK